VYRKLIASLSLLAALSAPAQIQNYHRAASEAYVTNRIGAAEWRITTNLAAQISTATGALVQAVSSVNGQTGVVVITAESLGVTNSSPDHATLTNLDWTATGHYGTPARLAGFFEGGMAGYSYLGAGLYFGGSDELSVSNDIIAGAALGATALQAEADTAALAALATNRVTRLQTESGTHWQDATGGVWSVSMAVTSSVLRIVFSDDFFSDGSGAPPQGYYDWASGFSAGNWSGETVLGSHMVSDGAGAMWLGPWPSIDPEIIYPSTLVPDSSSAHGSAFVGLVDLGYMVTSRVNTVAYTSDVPAIIASTVFELQTWSAPGTNAHYVSRWDITNGTWFVQEIFQ
jgi:hypothetical protein